MIKLRAKSATTIVCTLLLAVSANAGNLEKVAPGTEGISSKRIEGLTQLNNTYVSEGKLPGVLTMVARRGKVVHLSAAGTLASDTDRPIDTNTLFRIYSMTKPITAVGLMTLYEQGKFLLSDPVSKYLPAYQTMQVWTPDGLTDAQNTITMHHLLTHTAGFSYGFDPEDKVDQLYRREMEKPAKDLEEWADRVAKLPLKFEPGQRWHYSVASDLLGAVAEAISGMPFDQFLQQTVFDPLGMDDTYFSVPASEEQRLGANHRWDEASNKLVPLAPGERGNPSYSNVSLFLGGQGLVSTIGDYMKFAEMLRNGGAFNNTRILSPATVQFMTRNHLGSTLQIAATGESPTIGPGAGLPGTGFGLGFGIVTDTVKSGVMASEGTYYWGGAAGTIFWIDPIEDIVGIAMLQLMRSPWPFRQQMMVQTYQAIEELNGSH